MSRLSILNATAESIATLSLSLFFSHAREEKERVSNNEVTLMENLLDQQEGGNWCARYLKQVYTREMHRNESRRVAASRNLVW